MAIGAKLKQIIDDKGLKVSDLALQTGLNSQTIYSLISRDSNKVSIDALVKICNVLNVSVEELNQYDIKEKMDKGKRIRALREAAGMTQTELANKIGTTKQNLYKYESGIITNIPSDKIEAIADIFNVSPDYVMGWNTDNKKDCFNISVNIHEKAVITAYRNKPEMQEAVDKLLEVQDDTRHKNIDISGYTANIAAGTGAEGFTPEKLKEVDDFARQVAELERNRSE